MLMYDCQLYIHTTLGLGGMKAEQDLSIPSIFYHFIQFFYQNHCIFFQIIILSKRVGDNKPYALSEMAPLSYAIVSEPEARTDGQNLSRKLRFTVPCSGQFILSFFTIQNRPVDNNV